MKKKLLLGLIALSLPKICFASSSPSNSGSSTQEEKYFLAYVGKDSKNFFINKLKAGEDNKKTLEDWCKKQFGENSKDVFVHGSENQGENTWNRVNNFDITNINLSKLDENKIKESLKDGKFNEVGGVNFGNGVRNLPPYKDTDKFKKEDDIAKDMYKKINGSWFRWQYGVVIGVVVVVGGGVGYYLYNKKKDNYTEDEQVQS